MSKTSTSTVKRGSRPQAANHAASIPAAPSLPDARKRLAAGAQHVVEAGCLVTILAVPLYFSVLTETGYEADKSILLRALAGLIAGAWLVAFSLAPRRVIRSRGGGLLIVTAAAVFLAYAIATVFSINPGVSLWGDQTRQQGLLTQGSYLIILLAIATYVRERAHVERLITALLFGSMLAAAYGCIQEFGLDPVPATSGDPNTLHFPVRSTFGQHVFLGSYLVLVIPFTIARLIQSWEQRPGPARTTLGREELLPVACLFALLTFFAFLIVGDHQTQLFAAMPLLLCGYVLLILLFEGVPNSASLRRMRVYGYGSLLLLQVLTLAFTGARGAWIGFFVSLPVFGFLLNRRLGRQSIPTSVIVPFLLVVAAIVLLNIPHGPAQSVRHISSLQRLTNLTDSDGRGGSGKTRIYIWRGIDDLMTHTPRIGTAWGGVGRDVIGYGPDAMGLAFQAVFPVKLRQLNPGTTTWDRAHDLFLNVLVEAGILGLAAILAFYAFFFSILLGALRRAGPSAAWLMIAAGAAVAGHLVDGLFGLETSITMLLVWVFAGLIVVLPQLREEEESQVAAIPVSSTFWFWGISLPVLAAIAAIGPLANQPALLSAIWLLTLVTGVGVLAFALGRHPASDETGTPSRKPASAAPAARLPRRRWAGIGVIALGAAFALGSQMHLETATFADHIGLRDLANGQVQDAISLLQEASRANGHQPSYRVDLAGAYYEIGGNRSVFGAPLRATSRDALNIDPSNAVVLGQNQLYALAGAALESARGITPSDPVLYSSLGQLNLSWHHPLRALADFKQAEKLSKDNPQYLDQEAIASQALHRIPVALALAHRATALNPRLWYAYYVAAVLEDAAHNRAAARSDARHALTLSFSGFPFPQQQQLTTLRRLAAQG